MRHIGALLFDGFEMLDLYGPLEIFSMHQDAFQIHTVAKMQGAVAASGGPETVAQHAFGARDYDILLVPGGAGTRQAINDADTLDWLRRSGSTAELVTSVCTGAVLLGASGLLTGRQATTNKRAFDWVASRCPETHWQKRARWVRDGKILTSSGVSAGIDMSLAVVESLLGAKAAQDAADWAEYVRNTDPNNDPFEVT